MTRASLRSDGAVLGLVGVAVAVVAATLTVLLYQHNGGWMWDAKVYIGGGHAVLEGRTMYPDQGQPFTYPAFAALLFVPLAVLPFWAGAWAWTALSMLCLELVVWRCLVWLEIEPRRSRLALTAAACALAVWLDPAAMTLLLGQINLILLAVVLLDLSAPDQSRWKGLGVGVAAGIKLLPGFFILYLLLTRRFRAAAVAGAAFAATVAVGFAFAPQSSARYWTRLVFNSSRVGDPQNVNTESLRSFLARWLHTGQGIDPAWAVLCLLTVAVTLTLAVLAHRRREELLALCCCGIATLLISPITWQHHWVWLIPFLLWLGVRAWRTRSVWLGVVTAVVVADLLVRPYHWVPYGPVLDLHLNFGQLLLSSTYTVTAVLLLGLIAYLLRSEAPHVPPDLDAAGIHRRAAE